MAGFSLRHGVLHAEDVPLPTLAGEYGTPSYIYSATAMQDRLRAMQAAFRNILPPERQPLIAFACKANSNIAVLHLFGALGAGADIVSVGELARARAAGIPTGRIVFSGVGKADDEIRVALRDDVRQLNVESRPELERIAALAAELGVAAPVCFRINPDVDAKTHAKISTGREEDKFGLPPDEALALYAWAAKQPSLRPRGLSMHIGSQLTEMAPFEEAFARLAQLAREVKARSLPLDTLDLGGGLGVPYRDETPPDIKAYAELVARIIAPLGTDIVIEPGRYLVAEAGLLLSRVLYIKQGRTRRHVILDAGMNDLLRPALYDAWHPIWPVTTKDGPLITSEVVGPICETSDQFATARDLPDLQAGDLVAIGVAGAYGFSMASNYNTKTLPAEIMVDGARHAPIRGRQRLEDVFRDERIPAWLENAP